MAITVAGLRKLYPSVTEEVFPSERVDLWLQVSQTRHSRHAWGTLYEIGMYAYAAHKLHLEAQMLEDSQNGAVAYGRGSLTGESESVDGVSHSESYANSTGGSETSLWDPRPGNDYEEMARLVGISRGTAYVE